MGWSCSGGIHSGRQGPSPMAGKLGGVGGRDSRGGSADMAIEGMSAQMQAVRVVSMPQEIE